MSSCCGACGGQDTEQKKDQEQKQEKPVVQEHNPETKEEE